MFSGVQVKARAKVNTVMSLALEASVCDGVGQGSYQGSKDNVGELLQTWSTLSTKLPSNDATLIGIAVEICNILSKRNSFDALHVFIERLPTSSEYANNQDILHSKIALALNRRQAKVVQDIIKNNAFQNGEELIKAWDESHYMEEEARLQKPLTPLARFRVRKRNPPPKTICPSGMRKMASLPKGATRILKQWLVEHYNDPYPNGEEKLALAKFSGLTSNQVKTWFANARRRIHKGENLQTTKANLHSFDDKDIQAGKDHLLPRNTFTESYGEVNYLHDPTSFITPYFTQRFDHFSNGSGCDRLPGHSYRCIHSMYSPHACFHCKDMLDDASNYVIDYAASDARCLQHNMNAPAPVSMHHPMPTFSISRWSHRSPLQCRQEEFDAWYRSISYPTEMHTHIQSFDAEPHCDRSCAIEGNGQPLVDPCLQVNSGMQSKADNIQIDTEKDALTEVGAARILADLSSKQNFGNQFNHADSILVHANI